MPFYLSNKVTLKFLTVLMAVSGNVMAQNRENVQLLIAKAENLVALQRYDEAKYYYGLALKEHKACEINPKEKEIIQVSISQKILSADSINAYECGNEEYVQLLSDADRLIPINPLLAMKKFEDAYSLSPYFQYPREKIDLIIDKNETVQKQLLIMHANKMRRLYTEEMHLAESYLTNNEIFKALRILRDLKTRYPSDEKLTQKLNQLELDHFELLNVVNEKMLLAEEAYLNKDYELAKSTYRDIKQHDNLCEVCNSRLRKIEYYEKQAPKEINWERLLIEADLNYREGNYEMAQYQYMWLYNFDKSNKFVENRLNIITDIIAAELEEKKKMANAKLLLNQADAAFIEGDFKLARELYYKFQNRYGPHYEMSKTLNDKIDACDERLNSSN